MKPLPLSLQQREYAGESTNSSCRPPLGILPASAVERLRKLDCLFTRVVDTHFMGVCRVFDIGGKH
jgi:hypothetical protein